MTTVFEMPLTIPLTVDKHGFDVKIAIASRKSVVDFGLWAGMNSFAEGHYREMHDLGRVAFKVFLSTDPDSPRLGDFDFLRALGEVAKFDGLVGVHAENYDIIDNFVEHMRASGRSDDMAHVESRPDVAEVEAIQRALLFAGEKKCRLHICHLSSAQTGGIINWYKERGTDVSVETCHSYLVLDASVMDKCGARAKFNPPPRSAANRESLWEMLKRGDIDFVASDHGPYLDEDRDQPFWDVPPGLSGVDLLLPLLIDEGIHKRGLTLFDIAKVTAANAAKRFGIYPKKGAIRLGGDADFAVVDPDQEWTYSWKHSLGKSKEKATPYEGRKIKGKVCATFIRGTQVYDGETNAILVDSGFGAFVQPQGMAAL